MNKKDLPVISRDCKGRKIYADSIVHDNQANEYFIPAKDKKGRYGDNLMNDFYPLAHETLTLVKRHSSMDELKKMMNEDRSSDAVYNVEGDFNVPN